MGNQLVGIAGEDAPEHGPMLLRQQAQALACPFAEPIVLAALPMVTPKTDYIN